MKRNTLLIFIGILFATISFAQTFPSFVRSYGGTDVEIPSSIISLPDSGYVILGSTRSLGPANVNIYLIRTDKYGDTLWTKVIGNGGESGYCVRLTSDQNLILANTQTMLSGNCSNLMKIDLNGNILWSKAYGSTSVDEIYDLKITPDHGFVAIGNSENLAAPLTDLFIMKTDSNGVLQWGKHYGGAKWEYGRSIVALPNGGYISTGWTDSYNSSPSNFYDAFLLRINSVGDTLWAKRYSALPLNVQGQRVIALNDGGFLLSGVIEDSIPNMVNDIFLIRTDSLGDTLWTKKFIKAFPESVGNIISTNDNGFLIAGTTAGYGTYDDIYLIKTDSLGGTLWTKTYGGWNQDLSKDIVPIQNGYMLLSMSATFGATGFDYDMVLIQIDTNGNNSCLPKILDTMTVTSSPFSVTNFSPSINNYCIRVNNIPPITSGGVVHDLCGVLTNTIPAQKNEDEISIYPNPSNGSFNLFISSPIKNGSIEIYNSIGSLIFSQKIVNQQNAIDLKDQMNGLYFIKVMSEGKIVGVEKVVKE